MWYNIQEANNSKIVRTHDNSEMGITERYFANLDWNKTNQDRFRNPLQWSFGKSLLHTFSLDHVFLVMSHTFKYFSFYSVLHIIFLLLLLLHKKLMKKKSGY